jgi:hypothetical protein
MGLSERVASKMSADESYDRYECIVTNEVALLVLDMAKALAHWIR